MTQQAPPAGSPDEAVDLLVVGGGPAAHATVLAFREHGGGSVVLVSADDRPPYDRPPLSKDLLRGESTAEELPLDALPADVDLRTGVRVTALDLTGDGGRATLSRGGQVRFGSVVLCTGSVPTPLPVPGGDDPAVHLLRSAADGLRLRESAATASTAVVVGSGFIGCEAAASLAARGVQVTLVSPEPDPQSTRLGPQVAARLRGWLEDGGVHVLGGPQVTEIRSADGRHEVVLDDGRTLGTDLVLVAAGVRQAGEVAASAGVTVREDGRVAVDEHMRTGVPGVLAAGDVAHARNPRAGRHLDVEHWGEALAMGEVAGTVAAGARATWDAVPGFWSEIGSRTLKQAAWGDGWDDVLLVEHPSPAGAFTAWYGRDGVVVGVLTHEADEDYERGERLVGDAARWPPTT